MQRVVAGIVWRFARVASLVLLAVLGTVALTRFAPGYFSDQQEMDSQHATHVQSELTRRHLQESSFTSSLTTLSSGGLFGVSRQYGVPVKQLLDERMQITAKLMVKGLTLGWLTAFGISLLLGSRRSRAGENAVTLFSSALLCVPIAVMAAACLVLDWGGPTFVLAALIAIREFKLVYRLLSLETRTSQIFYARAQGYSRMRIVFVHVVAILRKELVALLMGSLIVALSAAVPVEVIFDKPGLGQLAWGAAMNRDLPVLVAVTVIMSALVGIANLFIESQASRQEAACV